MPIGPINDQRVRDVSQNGGGGTGVPERRSAARAGDRGGGPKTKVKETPDPYRRHRPSATGWRSLHQVTAALLRTRAAVMTVVDLLTLAVESVRPALADQSRPTKARLHLLW